MTEIAEPIQKLDPRTGFTCMNCRLVFANPDIQREHYRSEWHRYNVKRQVAELPPISLEQFQDKVQQFHQQNADAKAAPSQEELYCGACGKAFKTKNSYENHLNSKKHKENEVAFEAKVEKALFSSFKSILGPNLILKLFLGS